MAHTTRICDASWVAAWDETAGQHVYRRNVDVVFSGDRIVYVGPAWSGSPDETINGRDLFVIPGLINLHSHPTSEPGFKGIREEHGVPGMYMTGLYERGQAFRPDEEGRRAAVEVAYAELLSSGVTSIVDLSAPFDGWLDLIGQSGLRGFIGAGYASGRWKLENDYRLDYDWDEAAGRRGFDTALALLDEADRHPSGRLSGVVYPAQIDTCTEDLLRDSAAAARQTGRPITTHIAQSVNEFQEIVRRHGRTPVQWASELGLIASNAILGHAIFVDHHSWLHWHSRRDLDLIADAGATVAHCPTTFARYGIVLEDFGRYRRAGVNIGLGTDASPHNLLEEMRWAAVLARIAAENIGAVSTGDIFHAATVGGARALGRADLGRIAVGAKADLVIVDLSDVSMRPARDPLRSLVYTAADRAVRDVYVDGVRVVANRRVLTLDRADAVGRLEEAQRRMLAAVPTRDYAGRNAGEIAPLSLPSR